MTMPRHATVLKEDEPSVKGLMDPADYADFKQAQIVCNAAYAKIRRAAKDLADAENRLIRTRKRHDAVLAKYGLDHRGYLKPSKTKATHVREARKSS